MTDRRILLAQNGGIEPALVFSAPLASLASLAATGQSLQYDGNPQPTVKDAIPCLYLDESAVYTTEVDGMPVGVQKCSVSFWVRCDNAAPASSGERFFELGKPAFYNALFAGQKSSGYLEFGARFNEFSHGSPHYFVGRWIHYVYVFDPPNYRLYEDGELVDTRAVRQDVSVQPSALCFGANYNPTWSECENYAHRTYMANVKLYNYALSGAEVRALAAELTPIPEVTFATAIVTFFYGSASSVAVQTDPSGCTFSISGTLPSSVTFDAATGTFAYSGASVGEGTHRVVVTASKQGYTTASAQIDVVVFASAEMPADGLVFHAPLSSIAAKSEPTEATWDDDPQFLSGYPLSYLRRVSGSEAEQSNPVATTRDGIPCLYITDERYISIPDMHWSSWPTGKGITVSFWAQFTVVGGREIGIFGDCSPSKYTDNLAMRLDSSDGHIVHSFASWTSGEIKSGFIPQTGVWYNIAVTMSSDQRTQTLYVNGAPVTAASARGSSTGNEPMCIGRNNDLTRGDHCIRGYMAQFRIYSRVLSAAELLLLANEFHPQGGDQ